MCHILERVLGPESRGKEVVQRASGQGLWERGPSGLGCGLPKSLIRPWGSGTGSISFKSLEMIGKGERRTAGKGTEF